jgi:hypothetical protein
MRSNLKLVVNNPHKQIEERQFFEKDELKIILSSFFSKNCCSSLYLFGLFMTNFKFLSINFIFIY